jgi:preprotein translocase SecF subunit
MIDFLKYRYICAAFSLSLLLAFVGLFFYKKSTTGHAFTYSVEFTGGTQARLKFNTPITNQQLTHALNQHGWHGATTRQFANDEFVIRVKEFSNDPAGLASQIKNALEKELSTQITVLQVDSVGESVGSALSWNSVKAIIISLILMLLYIAFRFWSFAYATGAIVALAHDAIVIPLFFMLFDKEISMNVIGAIMAVLGYSINDTIVIFARIRQNVKNLSNTSLAKVVNLSINQTLRRTTLTSFATALVVFSLIILGGETLRDLALALLIGIIIGTYSSIYIASPVMLLLNREK